MLENLNPGDKINVYDNFDGDASTLAWVGNVDKTTSNFILVANQFGDVYKFNKKNQGRVVGYSWPYVTWTVGS